MTESTCWAWQVPITVLEYRAICHVLEAFYESERVDFARNPHRDHVCENLMVLDHFRERVRYAEELAIAERRAAPGKDAVRVPPGVDDMPF